MPVLWKKSFGKPVPTQPCFVHNSGGDRRNVRKRDQLYARRSKGVIVWQQSSTHQRERKTLLAITKVIASREHVAWIEAMIDLYNRAVHAIGKRCCQSSIRASTASQAIRARIGWLRPGIERQQLCNYRINIRRTPYVCCRGRKVRCRRDARRAGFLSGLSHSFIIDKEEGLVMDDRAAERTAKLICVKRLLRLRGLIEIVPCIQHRIAEKL